MSLHCDADEMLAQAKDLFARGHHNEARALAIDAAAVFEHLGNALGADVARTFAALVQARQNGDAPS